MRGYFEIGVYAPKFGVNIGTLWRSAYQLGAAGIFIIRGHYRREASDTCQGPRHIPCRIYETFAAFDAARPLSSVLVGVEMGGAPLWKTKHPLQALYLLGAEDRGLPMAIQQRCDRLISIESARQPSYNVAVAGTVVMYHRLQTCAVR